MESKVCLQCGEDLTKPRSKFCSTKCRGLSWRSKNPDYNKMYGKAWYASNAEEHKVKQKARRKNSPEAIRDSKLRTIYGISLAQYTKVLAMQGGGCELCGKTEEENGKCLSIDHDHSCCPGLKSCGKCLRGIICQLCNLGLGALRDSADLMTAAADYIVRHRQLVQARHSQ